MDKFNEQNKLKINKQKNKKLKNTNFPARLYKMR